VAQPRGGAIQALALDLDGTLLTSEKRVTADALATLRALLTRNLEIVVVTGKAPRLTARCLAPLELPLVCLDGAVQVVAGAERWLPHTTINDSLAAELLAASDAPCYVIAAGTTLVRGALDEAQFIDWSDQVAWLTSPQHLRRVTHMVFPHRDRTVLTAVARRVHEVARRLCRGELNLYVTEERFFDHYSLFIRSAGCTKLRGMRSLVQGLRATLGETMFIGDWVNDIPLLQEVGFPVAMRHAPPAVSSCARAMTLYTNDEDGVSRFLQAFFSIAAPAGTPAPSS
jgi:HAD superfamily hydrolase (TIGR01484 family)